MSDQVAHSAKASAAGFCRTEGRKFESPILIVLLPVYLALSQFAIIYGVLVFLADQ